MVRSEDVWKVHLNAKLHKENVIKARELKEKAAAVVSTGASKRPAPSQIPDAVPEKKPKGILKNATPQPILSLTPGQVILTECTGPAAATPMEMPAEEPNLGADVTLPEGFFDDPKKDAIARNLEYKDPVQEEWDRFQKEIRDAATVSNDIIAEDQEESTAERQIVEIDEQMRNWDRVLAMEKRKEERLKRLEAKRQNPKQVQVDQRAKKSDSDGEEDQDATEGVDEFGSWRAKGWNKNQ